MKDGKCTKCKGITFTNPEPNAVELCILCMDTVGFGNYKGREGCTHCFMTDIAGTDPFVCAGCSDPQLAPIDGTCRDKGTHECRNGHCSACAVTHIFFKYGCYDRYGSIAQRYICKAENQFELGNRVCCRKCVDPLFFINNGACVSETLRASNGVEKSALNAIQRFLQYSCSAEGVMKQVRLPGTCSAARLLMVSAQTGRAIRKE